MAKKLIALGVVGLAVVAAVATTLFGDYAGSRVAPELKFKILGPETLQAGEMATIEWDVSSENTDRFRYEKIEYCNGMLWWKKCTVLVAATPNNREAKVKVPATIPAGIGYLKMTARDKDFKLIWGTSSTKQVVIKAVKSSGSGGAGSGGSGSDLFTTLTPWSTWVPDPTPRVTANPTPTATPTPTPTATPTPTPTATPEPTPITCITASCSTGKPTCNKGCHMFCPDDSKGPYCNSSNISKPPTCKAPHCINYYNGTCVKWGDITLNAQCVPDSID